MSVAEIILLKLLTPPYRRKIKNEDQPMFELDRVSKQPFISDLVRVSGDENVDVKLALQLWWGEE